MIKTYTGVRRGEKLGKYWTVGELWLNLTLSVLKIDTALVDALDAFVDCFGAKPRFPTRNSLYCTSGHASGSYHYKGMAADFSIPDIAPLTLARYAEKIGMGGIGVYRDSARHIHIDTRPSRTCWWIVTTDSRTPGFGGVPCVFRAGNRSPAIKDIQASLNTEGCPCGDVDGLFGRRTHNALEVWQKARGLTADGVFGRATNAAMQLFDWQ